MTSQYVIELYKNLEDLGIKIWIDGGFGVDALLEKEIRLHRDLDIAIAWGDVPNRLGKIVSGILF
jgi:lincosamide nucleotidyltransferase A/C/D/E